VRVWRRCVSAPPHLRSKTKKLESRGRVLWAEQSRGHLGGPRRAIRGNVGGGNEGERGPCLMSLAMRARAEPRRWGPGHGAAGTGLGSGAGAGHSRESDGWSLGRSLA